MLFRSWQRWLQALDQERFTIQLGGPTPYCCWASSTESEARLLEDAPLPINRALAAHHQRVLEARQLQQRHQGLEHKLRQALARECALRQEQRQRLDQVDSSDGLQEQADALLCLPQPSRDQVAEAQKAVLSIKRELNDYDVHAEYVAEMVRQMIYERYPEDAYTRGFRVYTTLLKDNQEAAYLSLRKAVDRKSTRLNSSHT